MIAITAHSMLGIDEEVLVAGFDDYLSKPFEINDLINKLKKHQIGKA
jgi:CheY-like chemotaxis protein